MNATNSTQIKDLEFVRGLIRDVPDFPKPGILYKDITPLLADPRGLPAALDLMTATHAEQAIDLVIGIEARGFIFGAGLAARLDAGFVPVRKPGKLPGATMQETYALEYGSDVLEIHRDALAAGDRVLVCDDVIATGGTAQAVGQLVQRCGAWLVGYSFLIELAFLQGRARLGDCAVNTLLRYQ